MPRKQANAPGGPVLPNIPSSYGDYVIAFQVVAGDFSLKIKPGGWTTWVSATNVLPTSLERGGACYW